MTIHGVVDLSLPIGRFALVADGAGDADVSLLVPARLAGSSVWLQAIDLGSGVIGPGLEVPIL
jgi:hypothetical protein